MENFNDKFSDKVDNEFVDKCRDVAAINGHLLRCANSATESTRIEHAPFTLFPSPFPKTIFHQAKDIQPIINILLHKAAIDKDFVLGALAGVIGLDDFTRHLVELYKRSDVNQPMLLMVRSDYMLKNSDGVNLLRQIEMNTIAAGCNGLGVTVGKIHQFSDHLISSRPPQASIPNRAMEGSADALQSAMALYNKMNGATDSIVIWLTSQAERNIFDQRHIELALLSQYSVRSLRVTFDDVVSDGILKDGRFFIKGLEVAVVYYRYGYSPSHYPTEKEWRAREILDSSKAINCPSIAHQLVGTKKIQQVFSEVGVLERFLPPEVCDKVRMVFADMYSLDNPTPELINRVCKSPEQFVLKPMREGGGYNIFAEDIVKMFSNTDKLSSYILMERLYPPKFTNWIVRPGKPVKKLQIVGELGIFGNLLAQGNAVIDNDEFGWLLRSKHYREPDGGLCVGISALDSPLLTT